MILLLINHSSNNLAYQNHFSIKLAVMLEGGVALMVYGFTAFTFIKISQDITEMAFYFGFVQEVCTYNETIRLLNSNRINRL